MHHIQAGRVYMTIAHQLYISTIYAQVRNLCNPKFKLCSVDNLCSATTAIPVAVRKIMLLSFCNIQRTQEHSPSVSTKDHNSTTCVCVNVRVYVCVCVCIDWRKLLDFVCVCARVIFFVYVTTHPCRAKLHFQVVFFLYFYVKSVEEKIEWYIYYRWWSNTRRYTIL